MATVGDILVRLRADVGDFVRKMGGASAALKKLSKDFDADVFSKRLDRALGKVKNFGDEITKMGVVVGAAGALSFGAFKDFELQLNKVAAVTNATGDQFDQLKRQAEQLGLTTKFTASEAAEAMGHLGLAGFEVNQILGAMPATLQLAAAANLDMGRASEIAAGILRGMGLEVKDLAHVNDVLVATASKTNAELTDLGTAFKFVGPVAHQAGISLEEVAAAIGIMRNAGIDASTAGTGLRQILLRISRGAAEAANPTTQLGRAFAELGVQVTDASGNLLPLPAIVAEFEEKLGGLGSETERTAMLTKIFGERAQTAFSVLVESGAPALQKLTTELNNAGGTAQKIADAFTKGAAGAWFEFKSAVEGLALAIGEAMQGTILPQMRSLTQTLRDVANAIKEMDPGAQSLITRIGEMAVVAGPAALVAVKLGQGLRYLFLQINPLVGALVVLSPAIAGAIDLFERWATGVDAANAKAKEAEERYKTVGKGLREQADALKAANDILAKTGKDGKRLVSDDYAASLERVKRDLENVTVGSEAHKQVLATLNQVIAAGKKELDSYSTATQGAATSTEKLSEEAIEAREELAKIVEDVQFERAQVGATELERALAEITKQIQDAAKESGKLIPPELLAQRLREAKEETAALVRESGKFELNEKLEDLEFEAMIAGLTESEKEAAELRREIEELARQKGLGDVTADIEKMEAALERARATAAAKELRELGKDFARRIEDANPALDEFDRILLNVKRDLEDAEEQGRLTGEEVARGMDIAREGVERLREASKTIAINLGKEISAGMSEVVTGILTGTREATDVLDAFKDIGVSIIGKMISGMIEEKLDFDIFFKKNFLEDLPGVLEGFGGIANSIFGGIFKGLAGIVESFVGGAGSSLGSLFSGSGGSGGLGSLAGGIAGAAATAGGGYIGSQLGGTSGGIAGAIVGQGLYSLAPSVSELGSIFATAANGEIALAVDSFGNIIAYNFQESMLGTVVGKVGQQLGIEAGTQIGEQAGAQLASSYLSTVASVAGAGLGAYGVYSAHQIGGAQGAGLGALSGAGAGASIGSIIPGVGTVVGAIVGGVVGAIAGGVGGGPSSGQMSRRALGHGLLGEIPSIGALDFEFDPYVSGITSIAKAMEAYPDLFDAAGGAAMGFGAALAAAVDSGQSDAKEMNFIVSTLIDNFGAAGIAGPEALKQIATAATELGFSLEQVAQAGAIELKKQFDEGKIGLDQYIEGMKSLDALMKTMPANAEAIFTPFIEGGAMEAFKASIMELGTLGITTFGQLASYIQTALGPEQGQLAFEQLKLLGIQDMTELSTLSIEQLNLVTQTLRGSLGAAAIQTFTQLKQYGLTTMQALRLSGNQTFIELSSMMQGQFLPLAVGVFNALQASGIGSFANLTSASVSQLMKLEAEMAGMGEAGKFIMEALKSAGISSFAELAGASTEQIRKIISALEAIPTDINVDVNVTEHHTSTGGSAGPEGEAASGMMVPGPKGSPHLILAHGGETILPTHDREQLEQFILEHGLFPTASEGIPGGIDDANSAASAMDDEERAVARHAAQPQIQVLPVLFPEDVPRMMVRLERENRLIKRTSGIAGLRPD